MDKNHGRFALTIQRGNQARSEFPQNREEVARSHRDLTPNESMKRVTRESIQAALRPESEGCNWNLPDAIKTACGIKVSVGRAIVDETVFGQSAEILSSKKHHRGPESSDIVFFQKAFRPFEFLD